MEEAPDPLPGRQLAGRAVGAERTEVLDRQPEPRAVALRPDRRQRPSKEAVVGEEREGDAGGAGEVGGRGEAVVALDQLQPAVARVALELDVREPLDADAPQ